MILSQQVKYGEVVTIFYMCVRQRKYFYRGILYKPPKIHKIKNMTTIMYQIKQIKKTTTIQL